MKLKLKTFFAKLKEKIAELRFINESNKRIR